jgi:hypothetical protein
MYEHRTEPLLSRRAFAVRLARHAGLSMLLILGSLGLGAVGYHLTEDLSWLDAVLNAAMILTGMGPVSSSHPSRIASSTASTSERGRTGSAERRAPQNDSLVPSSRSRKVRRVLGWSIASA